MTASDDIRIGIVGVNIPHAPLFAELINGPEGTGGRVDGARVTVIWGDDVGDGERSPAPRAQIGHRQPGPSGEEARELARRFAIPVVVDQPSDMIPLVDAVMVLDDTGHGTSHGTLARPFLEAGMPTYIDKPMARDLGEARDLFDRARAAGAPLFSASCLRWVPELVAARDALGRLGRVRSWRGLGDGEWLFYGVHLAEMIIALGAGRAMWVYRHAAEDQDIGLVAFEDGSTASIEVVRRASIANHRLEVIGQRGAIVIDVHDYHTGFVALAGAVAEMARDRRSPIPAAETLAIMEILDAGERHPDIPTVIDRRLD